MTIHTARQARALAHQPPTSSPLRKNAPPPQWINHGLSVSPGSRGGCGAKDPKE
jgi:hypothetical protein